MDELRDTQYNLPIGTDCISRRKLLDKFEPWLEVHDYNDGERNVIKAVLYEIKCMPPATDNNVATRDCISRQAAIDVCDNVIDLFRGQFGAGVVVAIKESIEELPSAQPATDTNVGTKLVIDPHKIERAIRGLTEWQKHVQTESDIDRDISVAVEALKAQLGTNLAEVGADLISRQDAIDMIRNHWSDFSNADNYRTAKACVDAVPPIRPKRGKWTADNACSECGCQPWFWRDIHNYNFCPNCGADMREVTE